MKNTKNNKGFSLVELIVVVLIMAIIAVALAPQVMKWVNSSREATDVQSIDALVSACQLALTDKDHGTEGKGATYTISKSSNTVTASPAKTDFDAVVQRYLGATSVPIKSSATFTVKISADGAVSYTVTGLTSNDLDVTNTTT